MSGIEIYFRHPTPGAVHKVYGATSSLELLDEHDNSLSLYLTPTEALALRGALNDLLTSLEMETLDDQATLPASN